MKFKEPVLSADTGISSGASGQQALSRQPAFQSSVSAEAAESMPYAELKAKLRAEALSFDESTATSLPLAGESGEGTEEAPDAGADTGAESDEEAGAEGVETSPDGQATGQQDGTPTLAQLQRQLDSMSGNLRTLSEERRQLVEEVQRLRTQNQQTLQQSEEARLRQQHAAVDAHINTLPAHQQEAARQHYMNQLTQAALNDYYRHLQGQQQQVQDAELRLAVQQAPGLLREIADFVAQQREIPASVLHEAIETEQFRNLISSANTREGYISVMTTASEMLDFVATREAGRVAAEKEARRKAAAAQPKAKASGFGLTGADISDSRKIETMSREEFFKWKAEQLRAAQS